MESSKIRIIPLKYKFLMSALFIGGLLINWYVTLAILTFILMLIFFSIFDI